MGQCRPKNRPDQVAGDNGAYRLEASPMSKIIDRLKIIFLGLFALGVVGIWSYQIFWVWPAKRCDRQEGWWDASTRTCATPLYLPDLTGRPEGMSREEWSRKQAAKKIQSEQYGAGAAAPAGTAGGEPATSTPAPKASAPQAKAASAEKPPAPQGK
jgi:hypothetical protein